ncbi:MAG: VCBS repeat-containing protein [Planctomycetes bacterium]|nr:VCBS repeat-containing protein [Planctomycetota bacterium]
MRPAAAAFILALALSAGATLLLLALSGGREEAARFAVGDGGRGLPDAVRQGGAPAREDPGNEPYTVLKVVPESSGAVVDDVYAPRAAWGVDPAARFQVLTRGARGVPPRVVLRLGRAIVPGARVEARGPEEFVITPASGALRPGMTYRCVVAPPGGVNAAALLFRTRHDGPTAAAVLDAEGDGRPDILTLLGDGTLALHRNGGAIPLDVEPLGLAGRRLSAFCMSPLERDPTLYLLGNVRHDTAGRDQNVEAMASFSLRGVAVGTEESAARLDLTAVVAMASADITGDNFPDAVCADFFGAVQFLVNDGAGHLAPAAGLLAGLPGRRPGIRSVLLEDVNGDRAADLLLIRAYAPSMLFLGDGRGRFTPAPEALPPDGENAEAACLLDLDRDGVKDLFIAVCGGPSFLGLGRHGVGGAFRFQPVTPFESDAACFEDAGALDVDVATADFNGDGVPDVAVASAGGGAPSRVLLGERSGRFRERIDLAADEGPFRVARALDYDRDGVMDLFLAGDDAFCYLASPCGARRPAAADGDDRPEAPPLRYGAGAPLVEGGAADTTMADVDGDGEADVLVSLDGGGVGGLGVRLFLRRGEAFVAAAPGALPAAGPDGDRSAALLRVADVDRDGDADLVLVFPDGDGREVTEFALLRNQGREQGGQEGFFRHERLDLGAVEVEARGALVADVTFDGAPDLVVWGSHGLAVATGWRGSFAAAALVTAEPVIDAVAAEMTGDALPDLAALVESPAVPDGEAEEPRLRVYANSRSRPGAFFEAASQPARVERAERLAVVDLDGDSFADVVVCGPLPDLEGAPLALFMSRPGQEGERRLAPRLPAPDFAEDVLGLVAVDADDDGDVDLVAATPDGRVLLRNDGGGRLRAESLSPGRSGPAAAGGGRGSQAFVVAPGAILGGRLAGAGVTGPAPRVLDVDAGGAVRVVALSLLRRAP